MIFVFLNVFSFDKSRSNLGPEELAYQKKENQSLARSVFCSLVVGGGKVRVEVDQ